MLARKSVKQRLVLPDSLRPLIESFHLMCSEAIRIGLERDASSLKRLCNLAYPTLKVHDSPSCYKLCAISKAAGILAARKKSIRRGFPTKRPYLSRSLLVSCYGFKIENGGLLVPVGGHRFERISLNPHTLAAISQPGLRVRSFTITEQSLSLCIARDNTEIEARGVVGVDRNLRNVTAGNSECVVYYDVSKVVEIAENTAKIVSSFRRNDFRIRRAFAAKYGTRRQERIRQILNKVSKSIVENAKRNRQAIAFEQITGIRKLYRRGNGQARCFRRRMNSWPFAELKRQVEYKAAWEGVPVVTLTTKETRGTTMDCPRCGERLQAAVFGDFHHHRQMWCQKCERWEDRDLVAVMNISRRGWARFAQSQGEASEAVKGNPEGRRQRVILRVDASKPSFFRLSDEDLAEP